jgi:hypothetical protein
MKKMKMIKTLTEGLPIRMRPEGKSLFPEKRQRFNRAFHGRVFIFRIFFICGPIHSHGSIFFTVWIGSTDEKDEK